MAELEALINTYEHLHSYPRADGALHLLRKIASLVKPIMRQRSWHVGTLAEFFPNQENLLGLNENRGQCIRLRLRFPSDKTLFKPLEELVDTMLHELAHNVFGPHDQKFHNLWNELRDEYIGLKLKGYSGEGFLGAGNKLGGRGVPIHEMRRQARAQAERRKQMQTLGAGSGRKLGGAPVLRGVDMRAVIAGAVDRRSNITKGCGSGTKAGEDAGKEASRQSYKTHGFKTQAEEDAANEKAINEALWELIQDEEDKAAGLEPEVWVAHGAGSGWTSGSASRSSTPDIASNSKPQQRPPISPNKPVPAQKDKLAPPPSYKDRDYNVLRPRYNSRLVSEDEKRRRISGHVDLTTSSSDSEVDLESGTSKHLPKEKSTSATSDECDQQTWKCEICTLENPLQFLSCDACGSERPLSAVEQVSAFEARERVRDTDHRFLERSRRAPVRATHPRPDLVEKRQDPERLGWNCGRCGTFMEKQWWTCSVCGCMKETS